MESIWKGTVGPQRWLCPWCDLPPWENVADYDAHMRLHWSGATESGELTVASVDKERGIITFKAK